MTAVDRLNVELLNESGDYLLAINDHEVARIVWDDDDPDDPILVIYDQHGDTLESFALTSLGVEWEDARYLCDGCGRIGNADDGISEDGQECPDEECPGHVHRL